MIDGLSSITNPGTRPEYLVDTIRNLGPFLPIECELLGQMSGPGRGTTALKSQ